MEKLSFMPADFVEVTDLVYVSCRHFVSCPHFIMSIDHFRSLEPHHYALKLLRTKTFDVSKPTLWLSRSC